MTKTPYTLALQGATDAYADQTRRGQTQTAEWLRRSAEVDPGRKIATLLLQAADDLDEKDKMIRTLEEGNTKLHKLWTKTVEEKEE